MRSGLGQGHGHPAALAAGQAHAGVAHSGSGSRHCSDRRGPGRLALPSFTCWPVVVPNSSAAALRSSRSSPTGSFRTRAGAATVSADGTSPLCESPVRHGPHRQRVRAPCRDRDRRAESRACSSKSPSSSRSALARPRSSCAERPPPLAPRSLRPPCPPSKAHGHAGHSLSTNPPTPMPRIPHRPRATQAAHAARPAAWPRASAVLNAPPILTWLRVLELPKSCLTPHQNERRMSVTSVISASRYRP